MTKRSLLAIAALVAILFSSIQTKPSQAAQANPGACAKIAGATAAAPAGGATAAATSAEAPKPTATVAQSQVGSGSGNTLSLSGGFALYVLAQAWSTEYVKNHADIQFDIQAGGAGKGMTDVLGGAVEIAMLTRELTKAEADKGAIAYPVAMDAVVFTVNAENPVLEQIRAKGLTCEQLQRLFIKEEQLTWGQLLGTDDQTPISVYTRADSSGAADQIAKYLGANVQDDLKGIGVSGDPGIIEAVRKDTGGIGYNSLAFAYDPSTGEQIEGGAVVPLDQNGNGAIDPEEDVYKTHSDITTAVAGHKYPAPPVRNLYLVTKGTPQGATKDFITWVLTDGQAFVESNGFVKMPAEKIQAALDTLK